jgi:hypothetical protein
LWPGEHGLALRDPDTVEDDEPLDVAESASSVNVALWRRDPEVLQVRPMYPGASVVDARFLDDGKVALIVDSPGGSGAATDARELWRLDLATAQLMRIELSEESRAPA